jgi:hypothetical protein
VELAPLALIARLAALVPPPKRHLTGYFGVLSSHSSLRSQCVPAPVPVSTPEEEDKSPRTLPLSHYISWSELLRKTFEIDTICPRCKSPLRPAEDQYILEFHGCKCNTPRIVGLWMAGSIDL